MPAIFKTLALMMVPENQPPENVEVDWLISETNEYGNWTDRNPL